MKLYIYEHCPFCARVRFVGRELGLAFEEVIVRYDDDATLINLVGKRAVPLLVKNDGQVMAESNDIIDYFFSLAGSTATSNALESTLAWQSEGFPLLQRIGYPRWYTLNLGEFSHDESRKLWVARKQTQALNFDELMAQTPVIVNLVNEYVARAAVLLGLSDNESSLPLIDQAIIFSLLRGFYCEPTIEWPVAVKQWLITQSETLGSHLLA